MNKSYTLLMNEWRMFLNNSILNEIKLKDFREAGIIGTRIDQLTFNNKVFNGKKWLKPFDNNYYLQILYNTITSGESFDIDKIISNFPIVKEKILEPFLSTGGPIKASGARKNVEINSIDDITFSKCEEYIKTKIIETTRSSDYIKCLDQGPVNNDFELIGKTNRFLIYYPKTTKGSISIARAYYDKDLKKLVYDHTFSDYYGEKVGSMKWCTAVSGSINYFNEYYVRDNIHLYYLINIDYDPESSDRKYCLGIKKVNGRVSFCSNVNTTVDGNNEAVSTDTIEDFIGGNTLNLVFSDAEKDNREEFDEETYYSKKTIKDYIQQRSQHEDNPGDILNDLEGILKFSKDKIEIANYIAENENVRAIVTSAYNSNLVDSKYHFRILKVCSNNKLLCENLIKTTDNLELLTKIASSDNQYLKNLVLLNSNTPSDILLDELNKNNSLAKVIAINPNINNEIFEKIKEIANYNSLEGEKIDINNRLIRNPSIDINWKLEEIKKLDYDSIYDMVFYSRYSYPLDEKILLYIIEKFKKDDKMLDICLANKGLSYKNFLKYYRDSENISAVADRDDIAIELANSNNKIILTDIAISTSKREAIETILENEDDAFILLGILKNKIKNENDISTIIEKSTKKKLSYSVVRNKDYAKVLYAASIATNSSKNIDKIAKTKGITKQTYRNIINNQFTSINTLKYILPICPNAYKIELNKKIKSLQEAFLRSVIKNLVLKD